MNTNPSCELSLNIATVRVATELFGLRERLERVEHGLEVVFLDAENIPNSQTIEMLQELDVLQQSVGALANYLNQISGSDDSEGSISIADAVDMVPLREMADRLNGRPRQSKKTGIAELF